MNKQELIEKYEKLEGVCKDPGAEIARLIFLEDLRELDELQKVQVPQFVADWLEYSKNTSLSLVRSLMLGNVDFGNYANQKDHPKLIEFFRSGINQELFARAWLDGYHIEKEKRYLVKMKGVDSRTNYLYYGVGSRTWLFKTKLIDGNFRKSHTRKELEQDNFGWVFDCPGIEIEEVEG